MIRRYASCLFRNCVSFRAAQTVEESHAPCESRASRIGIPRPSARLGMTLMSCLLLITSCSHHEQPATGNRQPDVILITIDTLRADSVGYAGNTHVKTPFLDSLAAR